MDDLEYTPAADYSFANSPTTALFLALYLLVLAFFIVLVSISSPEEVKSRAVMNSLTSTFASLLPPTTDLTTLASREGEVLAAQAFQEQVQGVFATEIRVVRVEMVQPGRLMRVVMPTESLFMPGTTDIREAQFPLLDRIVASLSVTTPGLRYDLEFIIGSRYESGTNLPTGETLETARAGAFARAMLQRGAPPGSVAVGLRPGDPAEIVMRFYVRPENEVRLQFEKSFAAVKTRAGEPR